MFVRRAAVVLALTAPLWLASPEPADAGPAPETPPDPALEAQAERAWAVVWDRFFIEETETFADYLSSYEPGRELAHLPTAAEVRRQFPNPCGYGTGMEDGMILGGALLSAIVDRHAVTGDDDLREPAATVFRGVRRCATVHGVPGFFARNVCREDGESVYLNSSRDQYTHGVHGLWQYLRSPLADDETKAQIRPLLAAAADRMIAFATPENGYDFGRADGQRCPLGICRMWEVQAHEAARLPMIYAAAWDATGEEKYRTLWRQYVAEAVRQSREPAEHTPVYALLQMQCSLELLGELEPDPALKSEIDAVLRHVAGMAESRGKHAFDRLFGKSAAERAMLGPDWRTVDEWIVQGGYDVPQWGPYRDVWHVTREAGEAALIPLMTDRATLPDAQQARLRTLILKTDYDRTSSCGVVYHLAAYWKARRTGILRAAPGPVGGDDRDAAGGPMVVDADFEGASVRVLAIDEEARRVDFTPGGDPTRGWPCWWSFRLAGLTPGEPITLRLRGSDAVVGTAKPLAASWAMPTRATYSDDGAIWRHTEAGRREGEWMIYSVTPEGDSVQVAWGPPYTPTDAANWVRAMGERSPHATATELCQSGEGRAVPMLHVREGDLPNERRFGVWVQARQHAWESGSSWVAQGFGEWLLSDDADAAWLRRHAEVFLVPVMDVDNVATGNGGKNALPHDHNRDWSDNARWKEVIAARRKIAGLIREERMDVFLDLHNPGPGDQTFFYVLPAEYLQAPAVDLRDQFVERTYARLQRPGAAIPASGKTKATGPDYHPLWRQMSATWVNLHGNPHTVSLCLETAWNTPGSTTVGYRAVGADLAAAAAAYLRERPARP
ncbi:M14 family zinc carboxypeptidase [Alienimonas californiensis]|uniref:Zinc carboxypeptidase n=1 Tax=Alienimonas californiensis TaxID=2527989 RepID=A0A517PEZ5_9PLAN|nr:M14-type cytosolic carboxypeptidase [Alienimonas californiensis]QDT17942.1 Zinc carboxypeptidase [Alienimonas californiensis]